MIKNKKIKAKKVSKILKKLNIETRPFFYPMNKQDIFKKLNYEFHKYKFKNSEYLSEYGFYLPSYLSLKNNQIDKISKIVNEIIK